MLGRAFLVVSAAFLVLLGFAFYQDLSRPWVTDQQKYAAKYGQDFPIEVQQLFPKVQVNGQFMVERCITCHVPDIQKIGPQKAAERLAAEKPGSTAHPSVISDAVFAKYGQETLICGPPKAAPSPSASPAASPSARPSASPSPSSSAAPATASPSPAASPAAPPAAAPAAATKCFDPLMVPYSVLDANGKVVTDPSTNKPIVAQLTGFIPNAYKGLGIDESGCIICHNGNRQATDQAGAHQNLVADPFGTFNNAPKLYENNCAQCHGATGEGGKGPPLNDQNRLGFFNDDYYYRCIFLGSTGEEHKGTIMPAWGVNKLLPQPLNDNINLLVHWIRMWQQYTSQP
ncbi:MAG TPA: cytochrome c [Candidatus Binatus sp.]|nr:cytochrome c [Candidatus Binatus sp.]